jgi:hypothetical protein
MSDLSFIDGLKKKYTIWKTGVWIDIQSESLRQDVEFVLYTLPKKLIAGIEVHEALFETEASENQILVKTTMNALDIKRQIGKFVFRKKRWKEQEELTNKLLIQEKIDLETFYQAYETSNYLTVYEILNTDVFAVSYGNPTMNLDEIAIAVNSLYVKVFVEKNHSTELESFIDDLFSQE